MPNGAAFEDAAPRKLDLLKLLQWLQTHQCFSVSKKWVTAAECPLKLSLNRLDGW